MAKKLASYVSETLAPSVFHGVDGLKRRWKVTSIGILVKDEPGVRRTKGKPVTLTKIKDKYSDIICLAAAKFGLPYALIAAVIAAESRGDPNAEREEKGIEDWSFGLMQTITGTAHSMSVEIGQPIEYPAIPRGGDVGKWREALSVPSVSVLLGSAYLSFQREQFQLGLDPVLLYAAYNAGGPYYSAKHKWGLLTYGPPDNPDQAMDNFASWYGDACEVFA